MSANGDGSVSVRNTFELSLIIFCIILGIGILVSLIFLVRFIMPDKTPDKTGSPAASSNTALSSPEDYLPRNLSHMKEVPDAQFTDLNNRPVSLSRILNESENGVWFMFWASWCPDCDEQLDIISDMEYLSQLYGIDLVLIDRMNPEKENISSMREKLADNHVNAPCYIDNDEVCYKSWGIKEIPTSVVVDKEGRAVGFQNAVISAGECEGMLRRAVHSRCEESLLFIRKYFMNSYGGVYTTNGPKEGTPSGTDVLSESQGLLLLSALDTDDRELFDYVYGFTREHMIKNGLCAWYTDVNFQCGSVNATIDDLRIWYALHKAAEKWGGDYADEALSVMRGIQQYCINSQGGLVDFVEFTDYSQAETISLCYPDLTILEALAAENDFFEPVMEESLDIIKQGYISDEFPLYYSSYSYSSRRYSDADLNTAEALYVLWNLSRAGLLEDRSLEWLRTHVENSDLAARYHVNGSPVAGYEYHSTAVYSLAALIAHEVGDEELFELALRRMERMYILDFKDPMYGSYSQEDTVSYAFDQLMSLKVQYLVDKEAEDE